jgi:hypothetical protein
MVNGQCRQFAEFVPTDDFSPMPLVDHWLLATTRVVNGQCRQFAEFVPTDDFSPMPLVDH